MTVDIYQKPEALHFGLDRKGDTSIKKLRDENGEESGNTVNSIPWRGDASGRMVDITQFADKIKQNIIISKPFASSEFAMEMIEGVKRVRFEED